MTAPAGSDEPARAEAAARKVVERLRERGHVAFYAGGCVRDQLLGRPAADVDVATSATPDEVKASFRRTVEVGEAFGVVRVVDHGQVTEVATFRVDGSYVDGRRPTSVRFSTPEEDASRRDFTINGMFFDPLDGAIHDFVGGREDLLRGVVRAIGDPEARFAEDRLRILRAPRFAARLGFVLDRATADAAKLHAAELVTSAVSAERIHTELDKMLAAPTRARALRLVDALGLVEHVLPEAAGAHLPRVARALDALPRSIASSCVAWAVALHLVPGDQAELAMVRLKASNKDKERVRAIVDGLPVARTLADRGVAEQKRFLRRREVDDVVVALRAVDLADQGDLGPWRYLTARLAAVRADPTPAGVASRPLVMGGDLKQAGLEPGPVFGKVLAQVEDAQLEGRVRDREGALALALTLAAAP